jgi:serine/threonine protein kinase
VASWTAGLVGVSLGPRGRYRLEALIDEGGMAAVFEASDANLQRNVAIKLIRPALRDDPGFARRFEREARLVASLDHPHILPVLDFGETVAGEAQAPAGLLYLVMRLVRGTSLRRRLASGQEPIPWKPEQVLELAQQVLPALDYAHRRGVVHRDFKPENVLLEPTGDGYHAFLADFGLARAAEADPEQPRLTQTGQILGTPFYMAPEQWLGDALDARTDEYAVGVLL